MAKIAQQRAINGNRTVQLFASTGWRVEVTAGGKYWHWRKGSGSNRESRYGGKFEQLSSERKAEYEKNRKIYAR